MAISLRDGKIFIHIEAPLHLRLKHFSIPKSKGRNLVTGFDINSYRVNVVVIDFSTNNIVVTKTFWYSEVVSHGFPVEKAKWIRLDVMSNAPKWCRLCNI